MLPLETLVGERETAPVVNELIRRLCNPGEAIVDNEQLTRYIVGVYGVGAFAVERSQTDPELVTPVQFQRLVVPSLIRAGFDSGIVKLGSSGMNIETVNRERQPRYCQTRYLPEGTIEQINASNAMTDRMSDKIIDMVQQAEKAEDVKLTTGQKWIRAAYEMAKMAYGEKKRATGRPYLAHPEEIAAIVNAGLDAIRTARHRVSKETRALLICAALLHDALEEWRKPDNYYLLATGKKPEAPEVLTPLVIKTTMEKLGMEEGKASYLANAIRLVTHEKPRTGQEWLLTFSQYLYRGSGNRLVVPIKLTDMFHNLTVEPKPIPVRRPAETKKKHADRVAGWDHHRGEYYYYVYEQGYWHIEYEKNALRVDPSLKHWGPAYYEWLANLAYPDQPPSAAAEHVENHTLLTLGSDFAAGIIPIFRYKLAKRTLLPIETLAA